MNSFVFEFIVNHWVDVMVSENDNINNNIANSLNSTLIPMALDKVKQYNAKLFILQLPPHILRDTFLMISNERIT